MVVIVAQRPRSGVKVYVLVPEALVLITDGLHVPVIPLSEVTGSVGEAAFKHIGAICVKAGRVGAMISTSIVVPKAHCPASFVNE
tara:strand:- start:87 stop:341 length:255 start_codon:yes stop_codon:yes gene_type:complete